MLSFSLSACTKRSENDIQLKEALNTSVRLIKLDENIYRTIQSDDSKALQHAVFTSSLIKLGTIYDYVKVTNADFDDPIQFNIGDINALCWAASYVLNYAKNENYPNLETSTKFLKDQQIIWIDRLKREYSAKIFKESDCVTAAQSYLKN